MTDVARDVPRPDTLRARLETCDPDGLYAMRLRRKTRDRIAEAIARVGQTAAVEDVTRPNGAVTLKRYYRDGTHDYVFVDPWELSGISADSPFGHDPRRARDVGTD